MANTIVQDEAFVLFSDNQGDGVSKQYIANVFDAEQDYKVGNLVWYNNNLYQAQHEIPANTGWIYTDWTIVNISDAIAPAKILRFSSNPEYVYVIVDSNDTLLFGIKQDGSIEWEKGIPTPIKNNFIEIFNTLPNKVDKVVGKSLIDSVYADAQSNADNVQYAKITEDYKGAIINGITKDGVHHFYSNVSFDNNELLFTEKSISSLENALKNHGFDVKTPIDWSDAKSVTLPKPRMAIVNISGVSSMPIAKGTGAHAFLEYWDRNGNYFKKKIILDAQGSGSLQFPKKNFAFDLCNDDWIGDDTFKMKIGDWVEQDSFHGKAFWQDYFRNCGNVGFNVYKDMMDATYTEETNRTWKKAQIENYFNSMPFFAYGPGMPSDLYDRMDYGELCFPDGFPILVHLNGEFYGIFTWNLKKHRDNYHMQKSNTEHIHIDPETTRTLWNNSAYAELDWTKFEIRNPKDLITMDGKKYDGDNPQELIDSTSPYYDNSNKKHKNTAKVKQHILTLRDKFGQIMTAMQSTPRDTATATTIMNEIFDIDNLLDYQIFMDWVQDPDGEDKNWQWTTWDGVKWYVNPYDLDTIFGNGSTGAYSRIPVTGMNITTQYNPCWVAKELEMNHMRQKYAEFRNKKALDADSVKRAVKYSYNSFLKEDWENEWSKWQCPCSKEMIVDTTYWEMVVDENNVPVIVSTATNTYNDNTFYNPDSIVQIRQNGFQNWYYQFKCIQGTQGHSPVQIWGCYDSYWRLCKWLNENQTLRDNYYQYNG